MKPELDTYSVAYVEGLKHRINELESASKQARDDERWAVNNGVMLRATCGVWEVCSGILGTHPHAEGSTIHAAIRAVRVKVEGGVR